MGPRCYLHFKITGEFTTLPGKRIPSVWQAGRGTVSWAKWLLGFHSGCDHWEVFHFREPHLHPCSAAPPGLSCAYVRNPFFAKGSLLLSPTPGRSAYIENPLLIQTSRTGLGPARNPSLPSPLLECPTLSATLMFPHIQLLQLWSVPLTT